MKTTDFQIGEIVYDTKNKCYGVVLHNFPDEPNCGEIRLDSDGMQPIDNLHKIGSEGDKGTKKKLIQCLCSHKRLVDEYKYPTVSY